MSGIKKYFSLFFLLLFPVVTGTSQSYTATDSKIRVVGTSTLHDWEMESDQAQSRARFRLNGDGQPEHMESVTFRLNKTTLKSDQSRLDRRAYEALNARRHPEIVFSANSGNNVIKNGDNYQIRTTGDLTIAGVTRQVNLEAKCINGDDNKLICSGSSELKMSDFHIDPPVMFLGTLRTGDEIKIEYRVVFEK